MWLIRIKISTPVFPNNRSPVPALISLGWAEPCGTCLHVCFKCVCCWRDTSALTSYSTVAAPCVCVLCTCVSSSERCLLWRGVTWFLKMKQTLFCQISSDAVSYYLCVQVCLQFLHYALVPGVGTPSPRLEQNPVIETFFFFTALFVQEWVRFIL